MGNALVAAERWLYGVLSADATLAGLVGDGIYGHVVPPESDYPLVYFTFVASGDDVQTAQADRIWSELLYAVRMVGQVESYLPLETGASAIRDALHKASGSNVSGIVVAAVVEAPFAMIELDRDGYELRHLGSRVRLFVQ